MPEQKKISPQFVLTAIVVTVVVLASAFLFFTSSLTFLEALAMAVFVAPIIWTMKTSSRLWLLSFAAAPLIALDFMLVKDGATAIYALLFWSAAVFVMRYGVVEVYRWVWSHRSSDQKQ